MGVSRIPCNDKVAVDFTIWIATAKSRDRTSATVVALTKRVLSIAGGVAVVVWERARFWRAVVVLLGTRGIGNGDAQ